MTFFNSFLNTSTAWQYTSNVPWKALCVGLTLAGTAFELVIDLRQIKRLNHPAPPAHLVPVLAGLPSESESLDEHSSRVFFKSQKYARAKMQFGLVTSAINCVEGLLVLLNIDKLWHFAGSFLSKPAPIPSALSYLVVSSALSMLTSLPASYYKTFVLEKEHGFNKSTRKTWIIDQIKTTVLSMAIGLPLTAAALWIIEWQGPKFVQYLTGFILAIQMVAIPVFPYIQRLFNKFTLLQEYPESKKLHDLINSLAARLRFPLGKVYVIDGSTRSAHSNAYFIGLPGLTKQIVLYDTLLKDQTPEQVEAVLAHELGHWAHRDSLRMMLMSQVNVFLTLSVYNLFLFNKPLFASFGFLPSKSYGSQGVPVLIGFSLASALLTPLETIISFAVNSFSRRLEFAADRFAVNLGYKTQLKSGLISLMAKNSSIYDVDPLYSALHHSHPTLAERLTAIDAASHEQDRKEQ